MLGLQSPRSFQRYPFLQTPMRVTVIGSWLGRVYRYLTPVLRFLPQASCLISHPRCRSALFSPCFRQPLFYNSPTVLMLALATTISLLERKASDIEFAPAPTLQDPRNRSRALLRLQHAQNFATRVWTASRQCLIPRRKIATSRILPA